MALQSFLHYQRNYERNVRNYDRKRPSRSFILQRLFRMKFHTKLPPKWYFRGHLVHNDLRSVTSEVIPYRILYVITYIITYEMISEVSIWSFCIIPILLGFTPFESVTTFVIGNMMAPLPIAVVLCLKAVVIYLTFGPSSISCIMRFCRQVSTHTGTPDHRALFQ